MSNWKPPDYEFIDRRGTTVRVCMRCGCDVGHQPIHDAWHQRIDPAQVLPLVTGGLSPELLIKHDDSPEWTI